jgi:hypothetical protein
MKKFGFVFTILILAIIFSTASAKAQNVGKVRVNIPFEFSFGEKSYAAGNYSLRIAYNTGDTVVVTLGDEAGKQLLSILAISTSRTFGDKSTLLFDRSNGRATLTDIALQNARYALPNGGSKQPWYTKNRNGSDQDKQKVKSM